MSETAEKTDPKLWEKVKEEVTEGDKGGKPGQWSARKAQMAVQDYKRQGGGYEGEKSEDNSLARWGEEDWGTKSGEKSADTGERYLPEEAREGLTDEEYRRTSDKKRRDTKKGQQHSAQPADVAAKTAPARQHRKHAETHEHDGDAGRDSRAELYRRAQEKDIHGRSRMNKEQLREALKG